MGWDVEGGAVDSEAGERRSLDLSETYRHFDTLIWQVPSAGMAAGVGSVIAAAQIEDAEGWLLSLEQVRGVVLLLGAILQSALTVALLKIRIFSTASTPLPLPLPKPPFGEGPSAGSVLQLSISLTTGIVWGLAVAQIAAAKWFVGLSIGSGAALGVIAWIATEKRLSRCRKAMGRA